MKKLILLLILAFNTSYAQPQGYGHGHHPDHPGHGDHPCHGHHCPGTPIDASIWVLGIAGLMYGAYLVKKHGVNGSAHTLGS
jgi:hypothetical protein